MVVTSITLMRHAEREDRAMEAEGKNWIDTAPRPQDPLLSQKGNFLFYFFDVIKGRIIILINFSIRVITSR